MDGGKRNKWQGVTISLRTGGQGHPTSIYSLHQTHIPKNHLKRLLSHFSTHAVLTNRPTDGQTRPLLELRVRILKGGEE